MEIDRIIKKLAQRVTGNKSLRPQLHTVFFTKNKAVATDSFKMVEVTYHNENPLNIDRHISPLDIKNNLINIDKLDEDENGRFPEEYEKFFEKEGEYEIVGFNPYIMIDVLEVFKSGGIEEARMQVKKNDKIIISGKNDSDIEIRAIVMPQNIRD